jgi:hypothetical protein
MLTTAAAASSTSKARVESEPLKIQVSSRLVWAPAKVDVQVRVEPDPLAREISLEWTTPDYVGGSHLIQLEGERAPIRHLRTIRLDAGEYTIVAVLKRNDGSEVRRTVNLRVLEEGQAFDPSFMTREAGDLIR